MASASASKRRIYVPIPTIANYVGLTYILHFIARSMVAQIRHLLTVLCSQAAPAIKIDRHPLVRNRYLGIVGLRPCLLRRQPYLNSHNHQRCIALDPLLMLVLSPLFWTRVKARIHLHLVHRGRAARAVGACLWLLTAKDQCILQHLIYQHLYRLNAVVQ